MSMYPYQHQGMASPPRRTSTAHLVVAWVVALLTVFYMLPWAIAATRNKSNTGAIALVNLFLGWSLIGWVVALVMACSAENNQPQVVVLNSHGFPAYPVQYYAAPATQYPVTQYPVTHYPITQYPITQYPITQYATEQPAYPRRPYSEQVTPYAPAVLPDLYASSPATAPYPTSPATAPYPRSPATAPYPSGAVEITRPLPALSDPSSDPYGRQ